MNKKILISLSVIAAVAAITIGGTIAYFSDTETSTGNTFTAGSIDLKIDNTSYLNGQPVLGSTWKLTDLTNQLFFNFSDLKPGDYGEDTVSLHVNNNDAWACVTFKNLANDDNTCTEPEDADDLPNTPGCWTTSQAGEGELAQNLYFVFWADMCSESPAVPGDNIYQDECDYPLMFGPASDVLNGETYTLAAPGEVNVFTGEEDEPLIGSNDYYIGKAWCFGEMTVDGETGAITCNGESVDNASQSDSLTGDIIFYAEQARNNADFVCGR